MISATNWNDFTIFKVIFYLLTFHCCTGAIETGFPIVNDPCYNSLCFGPEKGKGGNYQLTDEQVIWSVSVLMV